MSTVVNDTAAVGAWVHENSKGIVFKKRIDLLSSKVAEFKTPVPNPIVALPSVSPKTAVVPSLAVSGKDYWKHMREVLTGEELKAMSKGHRHQKYLETKAESDTSSPLSLAHAFWKGRKEVLTEAEFMEERRVFQNKKRRNLRRDRREKYHFTSKNTMVKKDSQEIASRGVLLFEREPSRTSPDYRLAFVPVAIVRHMSKEHIRCLQDVEQRVDDALHSSPAMNSAHLSPGGNHGISLGLTVVSGGSYARDGWWGSIHLNRHLRGHEALQDEVIKSLSLVSFSNHTGHNGGLSS
jgi:hypothetical protein